MKISKKFIILCWTFAPRRERQSEWAGELMSSIVAVGPHSRWKSFQFLLLNLSRVTSKSTINYTVVFKARGWWPRNRSSTKMFFWRFVFLWVNLALLNPIKSFWWRGCVVQATRNREESCSFLDAIGRRSCGPLSGLAKNTHVGKPKLRLKRIETAGRYATVHFALSTCTWTHVRVLLVSPLHAYRLACYWKRSSRQR